MQIDVDSHGLFRTALQQLAKSHPDRANGIAIFLALKHEEADLRLKGLLPLSTQEEAQGESSGNIERYLDRFYTKNHEDLPKKQKGRVFKILSPKVLTPETTNLWRNSLSLQKGIACFANHNTFTKNIGFLKESYLKCQFRAEDTVCEARAGLNVSAQKCVNIWAKLLLKEEVGPKKAVFRKSFWNIEVLRPLFLDQKIPLYPLIVALYFGSKINKGRKSITEEDFVREFRITQDEFLEFFDIDQDSELNAAITKQPPHIGTVVRETAEEDSAGTTAFRGSIPRRVTSVAVRTIRESFVSAKLKKQYGYTCQICHTSIPSKSSTKAYAEGCHIRPLNPEHSGEDGTPGNLLILCPNHHVALDKGTVGIDPETFEVYYEHTPHFNNLPSQSKIALKGEHLREDVLKELKNNLSYHYKNIFQGDLTL